MRSEAVRTMSSGSPGTAILPAEPKSSSESLDAACSRAAAQPLDVKKLTTGTPCLLHVSMQWLIITSTTAHRRGREKEEEEEGELPLSSPPDRFER